MSMSEYYNSRYPYVAEYNREAADWADDYLETVYSGKVSHLPGVRKCVSFASIINHC